MGYLIRICVVLCMILGLLHCSMGAYVHYVGGVPGGWNRQGIDYVAWASIVNFVLNDIIVFSYDPSQQNVVKVKEDDYRSCSWASPIAVYTSGNDAIKITSAGDFYFISGVPGMWESGQRVEISVLRSDPSSPPPPPYHVADPDNLADPYGGTWYSPSAQSYATSTLNIHLYRRLAAVLSIMILLCIF